VVPRARLPSDGEWVRRDTGWGFARGRESADGVSAYRAIARTCAEDAIIFPGKASG